MVMDSKAINMPATARGNMPAGRHHAALPLLGNYANLVVAAGVLAAGFFLLLLAWVPRQEPITVTIVWRHARSQAQQLELQPLAKLAQRQQAASQVATPQAASLQAAPQEPHPTVPADAARQLPPQPQRGRADIAAGEAAAGQQAAATNGARSPARPRRDAHHREPSSGVALALEAGDRSGGNIFSASSVSGRQEGRHSRSSGGGSGGGGGRRDGSSRGRGASSSGRLQNQHKQGSDATGGASGSIKGVRRDQASGDGSNITRSRGATGAAGDGTLSRGASSRRSSRRQGPSHPRSKDVGRKHSGSSATQHGGNPDSARSNDEHDGRSAAVADGVATEAASGAVAGAPSGAPSSESVAAEGVAPQHDNTVTPASLPSETSPTGPAVDWAACLKEDDVEMPFTANDFMHPRPARVKVEAVFNSRLPRAPTAVTMFVIASASRLEYLDALCMSWASVMTLAYYIAVPANATDPAKLVSDEVSIIRRKFEQLEARAGCQLDVMAVSERVEGVAATLFPINVLRNLALLMAQTKLVMLGDLDMLIGTDLQDIVTGDNGTSVAKYQQLLDMTAGRRLVVVPTFQTWVLEWAVEAAEGGKDAAVRLWDGENFRYFLQGGYEPAHGDTDVARWVNATDSYELANTNKDFEPWWIARRANIAPYDVRHRGYGKDKVQHLHEMVADLGFRYVVHPKAYMVHRPHEESAAKQQVEAEFAERRKREAAGEAVATLSAEAQQHFSLAGMSQRWLDEQFEAPPPHKILVCAGWRRCRDSLLSWDVYGGAGEPMQTVTSLDEGGRIGTTRRRQLHDTDDASASGIRGVAAG